MVSDAQVEAAIAAYVDLNTDGACTWPDDYGGAVAGWYREFMRAALEAAEKAARKAAPDWYWRHFDPDDAGDSIHEALRHVGEGVVCHIGSSYVGPSFFAAMVPVLDLESDDTEEIAADTEEECLRLVKEHMALYNAMRAPTPPEASHD